MFASCNLLGVVVVYFFLYESSGLSLEAVDTMYSDPAVKVRLLPSLPLLSFHRPLLTDNMYDL